MDRLCFKHLSSLEAMFRTRMHETRDQYNEIRAQVKEMEHMRLQRSNSDNPGVVFNLNNNLQPPPLSKLKSRRFRRGNTTPQPQGRDATRQEAFNALQRYRSRTQAQATGATDIQTGGDTAAQSSNDPVNTTSEFVELVIAQQHSCYSPTFLSQSQ